jgi:hypothetical protein
MRMAQLLRRAIRCIVCSYFLPASVAISTTSMSAISATAMITETTSLSAGMTGESAAIEVAMVEVATVGISVAGIATIDVPAIGVPGVSISTIGISTMIGVAASIGITATVVFALKATSVKTTTVEICCIPSLEKRPIVCIIGVIPIMSVPNRVIVICIPGELSCKGYSIAVGISIIGVGIGTLICGIGLLVDGGRLLIGRRRLLIGRGSRLLINRIGFLCIAPGGDQQAGGCQGGERKDPFHFVCYFKLAAELCCVSLILDIRRQTKQYI